MIYFDNAATSFPKPKIVYDEIMNAMVGYGANPGRSGHKLALQASRGVFGTRETISKLFNIKSPMNVVLTFNCTESLNMAIKGVLKPGDHVITTSMEHNSVLRPIVSLEKLGIKNTIVQGDSFGRINPEDIKNCIRPNTKLIVTTHISNLTGTIMDIGAIGEIAKSHGILYLVDGAQSAGVYNIDVDKMNIDMLAFPGHKGLLGPQGTGGLYIREGIEITETFQGGTGSISHSLVQPDVMPDKFESGTPNAPGIVGLGAGIKHIMKIGIDTIREKEEALTKHFIEEARKIVGVKLYGTLEMGSHAPVVALNVKEADSSEVSYILDEEYNIAVRPGLHCAPLAHKTIGTFEQGVVRFSFGYENTHEEIDFAIKALKDIAKEV
ncbi:aminotransferase class V-fold PLP-dependent enzyme [Tissierella sp.]|uniref:aminotransferase class V-fold PLP-dependent enzyme n=1 Tax=Tissierella sp. TaxID=41274 RepID=UPI00285A2F36|nr:aminotransferase class V-fold PLP-dependent enzyme [Tissierella sp.]MDR7854981.1 aminotransferase class V-fold PLP-dependent enzyme [Tissierella sp.]